MNIKNRQFHATFPIMYAFNIQTVKAWRQFKTARKYKK